MYVAARRLGCKRGRSVRSYRLEIQTIMRRGNRSIASTIVAAGVNIGSDVPFSFSDLGTGTLAIGIVFTVIDNTSNFAISGRFSNLSNGLVFRSKGTNFQVNYKGGTGNDLTLTIVP